MEKQTKIAIKRTRLFLGATVFPLLVFAFLFPLLGIVTVSGALSTNLLAGVLFAAITYFGLKASERYIPEAEGSSPRKVMSSFVVVVVVYSASILATAALLPSVTVGSLGLVVVAALAYPFGKACVTGA